MQRLNSIYTLLLLVVSALILTAQNDPFVDSLKYVVQTTKNSEIKATTLCKIARFYKDIDSQKAYRYATQSYQLAIKTNNLNCVVSAFNEFAILDRHVGNYSKALISLKKAIKIANIIQDTMAESGCYITVGDIYSDLLSYDKALSYYNQVLKINRNKQNLQVLNALSRIGHRLMDKGTLLNDTTYYLSAISSYLKVMNISLQLNNTSQHINAYVNLADAYNIFGKATNNKHHLYTSLNYSLHSLRLAQSANLKRPQALSYLNLGEVYLSLNKNMKALHYFEMAEKIYQPLGIKSWLLLTYEYMGKVYFSMQMYSDAKAYTIKAITLAIDQQSKKNLRDDYQLVAEILSKQKKFAEACDYYKLHNNYKDSVINEVNTFNISRLQTEIDLQSKEKEIAFLTKNKETQNIEINYNKSQRKFLIILLVFILFAFIIVYFLYREKKKATLEIIKAKDAAEKAKDAQEQFLANTSHEIRTPMNGIIGMTGHLMGTTLSNEQQEYVTAIKESSNNLLSIINELLDLSKIVAKKIVFNQQPFELHSVIKNLIHLLEFRAIEKNIQLSYNLNKSIPKIIIGDAVRLQQILLNLAENSVKFTKNGTVEIKIDILNETNDSIQLQFSVNDTGIGIPENKFNLIFENFTQVNSKTTRKYGGTGLGLSITKQLVEQQGGNLSVRSTVNVGSTFVFDLNFKKDTAKDVLNLSSPLLSPIPKADLYGITVLIVDDNKINLRVAALTLQKWNVNIEIAISAKEAYEKLNLKNIDLVLMDITMPDIDGFEASSFIRSSLKAPICNVPIIAMTAAAFVGDREKCIAAGMNDYISKPFSSEDLLEKIRALLPKQLVVRKPSVSDLSLIYEKADGDMVFLKDIIECYILEMPVYIKEMEGFLISKNYEGIIMQAHKMRSPIALMGAQSLKELYLQIEINAKQNCAIIELTDQITSAQSQCLQTIEELKLELQKLNLEK